MKKLIKYLVLSFAGCFLIILSSCGDRACLVKIDDFNITAVDFSKTPNRDTNAAINKDSLGFSFSPNTSLVGKKHKSCYMTIVDNPVISISIKTLFDYSDGFLANSDVTTFFQVGSRHNHFDDWKFITIDELVDNFVKNKENNYASLLDEFYFILFLKDDTCKGGQQKFEITIVLSDGTVLIKQTDDLLFE